MHKNRLNSEELKQIDIVKDCNWHNNNIDYTINIKNNSKVTLNKISLVISTGIYLQYDFFRFENKFTKIYPITLKVEIPPNTEHMLAGSIEVEKIVLTEKQKQEGWRPGIYEINVSYIESIKEKFIENNKTKKLHDEVVNKSKITNTNKGVKNDNVENIKLLKKTEINKNIKRINNEIKILDEKLNRSKKEDEKLDYLLEQIVKAQRELRS